MLERQSRLAARRPQLPKRAPIETTTLAADLCHHDPAYRAVLDTLRIALANAETELTVRLALPGDAACRPLRFHLDVSRG